MSCFVVNDYHVNALVAWGLRHGAIVGISPDALAHMLACANRAAYAERYQNADQVDPFEGFDRSVDLSHLPAVAIVKACDCLAYQASDWSSWYGSEPSAHLAVIRARAVALARAGAVAWGGTGGRADQDGRDLPGYDAAPWHLDYPDTPADRAADRLAAALGDPSEPIDQVADRLAAALGDMTEPELAAIRSAMLAVAIDRRAAERAGGAA